MSIWRKSVYNTDESVVAYIWPNSVGSSDSNIPQRFEVSNGTRKVFDNDALGPNQNEFSLDRLRDNLQRLNSFRRLGENWDNQGAPEINVSAIENVEYVISGLKHQPFIFPTSRGSIQLEYGTPGMTYMEIEVFADEHEGFARVNHETWDVEGDSMVKLVQDINEFNTRVYSGSGIFI